MKIEVLISCMHQKDHSIVERTNIQSDVIVVNQCDEDKREEYTFKNLNGEVCRAIFISTKERGLSKSRNMALSNASGDICLICDDDEKLDSDYVSKIKQVWEENSDAGIIAFKINNLKKKYSQRKKRIGYIGALRLSSVQLTFCRKEILDNTIEFDESLGSGVSKAGGEENKFIYDCLHSKLNIYFYPVAIGKMTAGASLWFHGYTSEYFVDRGIMTRKLMGTTLAIIYAFYFLLKKYSRYHADIGFKEAFFSLFKGIFRTKN